MALTESLSGISFRNLYGGKAFGLRSLEQHADLGYKVPSYQCVNTDIYDSFLRRNEECE